MMDVEAVFKNRKVTLERLLPFGFSENEDSYTYATDIAGGQFEMAVTVSREGAVSAEVIDGLSKERYILHRVPGATGAFVGKIREEYGSVLAAIADACFEPDVFKSESARQVIRYVGEKYGDELQFLWKRFPGNAIFRRQDNAKWYAALLIVPRHKLGLDGEDAVDIIDLRIRPEELGALIDGRRYLPGYHMNKKHWLTICLDGSVPQEEIHRRIDESFALAAKRPQLDGRI